MRTPIRVGVTVTFMVLALGMTAVPAHAQNNGRGVLGMCAAWNLALAPDCAVLGDDSPVGMALTTDTSPNFAIWANAGSVVVENVSLVVFVPDFASPTFSVTFTQPPGLGGTSTTLMSGDVLSDAFGAFSNQRVLQDVFGLTTFNQGTDYSFGNVQGVQAFDFVTGYEAFLFQSGFDINTSDPDTLIDVQFGGDALPNGTIIVAVGFDYNGTVIFLTPLTVGMQVVPEPGTMLLLGSGLLGVGLAMRRKLFS